MSSNLASFLAENYLTADLPTHKKKKRKRKQIDGLLIAEDDAAAWPSQQSIGDLDDCSPLLVAGTSSSKPSNAGWKSLRGVAKTGTPGDADATTADAILASAVAETAAARQADDEVPIVKDTALGSEDELTTRKMEDGTCAGLQSAASVAAQLRKQRTKERDEWKRETEQGTQETAYRDATGRRVDVSLQREAARKAEHEAMERQRQASEALVGDVQAAEARLKREELARAKYMTFARSAGDEEMNQKLKERDRWNDPMAQFLSQGKVMATGPKGAKQRPIYSGPAPPNRYGIRPGYRWDGVDRGNGLEAERYKCHHRRERTRALEYVWQMD